MRRERGLLELAVRLRDAGWLDVLSQEASRGRSRATTIQTKAQRMEGMPSRMKVICQPTALMR